MTASLSLEVIRSAVSGSAAAFRRVVKLEAAGGSGSKVLPPTYEGGRYATERRRLEGQTVDCVLLDAVQSQANRMEAALQSAVDEERIRLPIIRVDFGGTPATWVGAISSLQAPHRIADAILRDSLHAGTPFRKSVIGRTLDTASVQNATGLFSYCPTALVFGLWDSTGPRGGMGARFPRTLVSEIIGVNAVPGQRTSSRIDPLQIQIKAGPVYETADGDWTLNPERARQEKGAPVKMGRKGNPSEINHGNVMPSLQVQKDRNGNPLDRNGGVARRADDMVPIGGYTIDYALQTTTQSLPALRRLRFPDADGHYRPEAQLAARTTLAALGLCAAALAGEGGYDLRSGCLLTPISSADWELLDRPGTAPATFDLTGAAAIALLQEAVAAAQHAGLPWQVEPITLTPRPDLVELVVKSYVGNGVEEPDEG